MIAALIRPRANSEVCIWQGSMFQACIPDSRLKTGHHIGYQRRLLRGTGRTSPGFTVVREREPCLKSMFHVEQSATHGPATRCRKDYLGTMTPWIKKARHICLALALVRDTPRHLNPLSQPLRCDQSDDPLPMRANCHQEEKAGTWGIPATWPEHRNHHTEASSVPPRYQLA